MGLASSVRWGEMGFLWKGLGLASSVSYTVWGNGVLWKGVGLASSVRWGELESYGRGWGWLAQ